MRKKAAPAQSSFGLFEVAAILGGLGVVYWFMKGHSDGGRDLWDALGYPYGPTGNLAGIGGQFFVGNLTGAATTGGALPVILTPQTTTPKLLSDIGGTSLTDIGGTGLTDVQGSIVPPGLVPSFNGAALKINPGNRGRDWPALPLERGQGR